MSRENGKEISSQCWSRFWKHFRDEDAAKNWLKIWESICCRIFVCIKVHLISIFFLNPALQLCCLFDNVSNLIFFVILIFADDIYGVNAKNEGLDLYDDDHFNREDGGGKLLLRSHLTFNSWTLPRERKFYNIMTHNAADVVFVTNSACVKLSAPG